MDLRPTPRRGNRDVSGLQARAGVILSPADIDRILAAAGRGSVALRNSALVLVMLGHGLSISDLRDLKVRDFLNADGSVRRDAHLEPTRDSRTPRRLLWLNKRVVSRVEAYLNSRAGSAKQSRLAYRGLDADAPLFPAHESLNGRPDGKWVARGSRVTSKWLSELLCSIFQEAKIYASPVRSARLTLAHRMLRSGVDEVAVSRTLGMQGRDLVRRLRGQVRRRTAEEALAKAL